MNKKRLMELAGIDHEQHEQQETAQLVVASVRDAGDGNFIGLVGPFQSEQHAQKFFSQLPEADDLSIEIEATTPPEQFADDMSR